MNQKLRVGKDYIVTLENKIEGFQIAISGMNKLHDEELENVLQSAQDSTSQHQTAFENQKYSH